MSHRLVPAVIVTLAAAVLGGVPGDLDALTVVYAHAQQPTWPAVPSDTPGPSPTATPKRTPSPWCLTYTLTGFPIPRDACAYLPHVRRDATPTRTPTPTSPPTNTPPPTPPPAPVCGNALPNGGFDNKGAGWLYGKEVAGQFQQRDMSEVVRSGVLRLGGADNLVQGVAALAVIPALPTESPGGGRPGEMISATLEYDLNMSTSDSSAFEFDGLALDLASADPDSDEDQIVRMFTNVDAYRYRGWNRFRDPVTLVIRQRPGWVTGSLLMILSVTDASKPSTWQIDNVALNLCYWHAPGVLAMERIPLVTKQASVADDVLADALRSARRWRTRPTAPAGAAPAEWHRRSD